jgi:hypothetical protein
MRRITPEQEARLLAHIRAGCYPHVAAECAGIPRLVFRDWLFHGRRQKRGCARRFWLQVCEAQAVARALAESEIRKKDVKFWLRYGPGKERRHVPGWGTAIKPRSRSRSSASWMPELFATLERITEVLSPFPEARQAILATFDREAAQKQS